jgi:ABC-type amino acid transport substrate-binding protein
MMIRRIACLTFAVALLQACETTGGASSQPEGTLQRIAATGQINLGVREDRPPMSFRDQSGNFTGYSVDLCAAIAEGVRTKLGRRDIAVNYVPVSAEARFEAVKSGQIDILCGATTKTLSRAEEVGFTQLTFATGASLISLEGRGIEGLAGLRGKRVAVTEGTTTIDTLRRVLATQAINAEIVPVESAEAGMALLDNDAVDAFAADQVVLIGLAMSRPSGKTYGISKQLYSFEPFALAIRRGDPDFQLVADRVLSELNRTGRIGDVYSRWFGRFAQQPPDAVIAVYTLGATPE